MKKTLLFFIFLILFSSLFAQQDPAYSMYRFNGLYLNPANAGSRDRFSSSAIYRAQWVTMPGAPQSVSATIHSPLLNDHLALGAIYSYDVIGVAKTNSFNANFAYRIFVGKKKDVRLSFGISAGFDHYRADFNKIATTDPDDPSFEGNVQKRFLPNVGAGFYAYSKNFFAGISVPRIFANRLNGKASLFATSTGVARQYQNILITGGYAFELGKKVKLIPSVLFRFVPKYAPFSADFNINFLFIERINVGAAYRLNDSYNFMLIANITKNIRIGYSYDVTVSALNKYNKGSHEVMIGVDSDFGRSRAGKPEPVTHF